MAICMNSKRLGWQGSFRSVAVSGLSWCTLLCLAEPVKSAYIMYFWPRLSFSNILELSQQMLRLWGTISHSIIHQQKKNVRGFGFRKWRLWQSTWIKAVDCSYSVGELTSGCKSCVKVTLLLPVRIVFIFVLLVAGSNVKPTFFQDRKHSFWCFCSKKDRIYSF